MEKIFAKTGHNPIFAVRKRCRVGQGVKTPPFHGGITGSIPVRGTKKESLSIDRLSFLPTVFQNSHNTGILITTKKADHKENGNHQKNVLIVINSLLILLRITS